MATISTKDPKSTRIRHKLGFIIEPNVLFPIFAVLGSFLLWWATLNLIKLERTTAEDAAKDSVQELTETYEAQVVRALREIDQELKLVQYAYAQHGGEQALEELDARDLLPPAFLFAIGIFDPQGKLIASNRSFASDFSETDHLQKYDHPDLEISVPQQNPETGEWTLQFSRHLSDEQGDNAGIVVVEVDATFFVSGYESSKLGNEGVLAILGADGIYRIRRVGESVSAGDKVDYASVVPEEGVEAVSVTLAPSSWDRVPRYTGARELFNLPLAVVVGLSRAEQLSTANQHASTYLWRATGINVALLLVLGLLWRLSHALARSRHRETEARIAHAKQVEYLAYHDSLTGLPNRSLFSKLLEQSISQAQRYDRKLAVLFLDLDHFKHINDTLGHEVGDQLLQEVSDRLKSCLRESDTVARLGGDEFVVVLPELTEESYTSTVARKMIAALARPFILLDQEFRVTASIGISVFPQDGQDEQTLTKNADVAMYQAKEDGKNNFQYYSEKLHSASLQRLTLETSLRHALERQEFQLHYQAKRDVRTGRITGMEALLRWQHPDLGMVPPMQFIPLAEETGLILPIGKWVLKTACEQNMAWQKQGLPLLSMAVNLSAQQFFDSNLPEYIGAVLKETGMEPGLLELEITESLLMRDVERALKVLNRLKETGVHIAIDDFGVGYSSLAMLKQFPLDAIKIDRTFIRDVTQFAEDRALTEAIVAMGRTLSLTVVAQGVETREQADFLRDNACDEVQGFYFNKPVPADEFAALLQQNQGESGTVSPVQS